MQTKGNLEKQIFFVWMGFFLVVLGALLFGWLVFWLFRDENISDA